MNRSIYDETLRILHESFAQHINVTEAKLASQKALFELLESNPQMENDIRMGILHFYNQCGLGCFVHYDKHQLQVITRIKNPTHNLYVQRIYNFLKDKMPHFNPKAPADEDFKALCNFADSMLDLQTSAKRDALKAALRQVFGIQPRDALFFKDGHLKVSQFDYEIVKINSEIRKINSSSHINVLNNDDKKALDNALLTTNIQSLIVQNTLNILHNDIDLTSIDNLSFNERFSFFAIQKLRVYLESLHISEVDSLAKSIYCMGLVQKYAWVMFEVVAKELLELCAKDNANATAFIEFYNGAPITLHHDTFKKPSIIDSNGNTWTMPRIKEVLKNKMNVEFDIERMQKQADTLSEQIHSITTQIAQNEAEKKEYMAKDSSYQDLLESQNRQLRTLVDKKSPKEHIDELTNDINALILNKSNVLNHLEQIQSTLADLNNQHLKLLNSQETLQEQISYSLKKNKERFLQYDLLTRALSEALANGRELV